MQGPLTGVTQVRVTRVPIPGVTQVTQVTIPRVKQATQVTLF
jgi:hypothetical protein